MPQPFLEPHPATTEVSSPPWFFLFLMFLVFEGVLFVYGPADISHEGLFDPDSYSRLNRVLHLVNTENWFDVHYPRSNAPYGEVLHWTRPLDVLLLIGAWVLSPFGTLESGLYWWGVVISPLFFGVGLCGLMWMTKSLFERERMVLLGCLFLLQPVLVAYSLPGRPDHHSLLLACFVWVLALTYKLLSQKFQPLLCCALGALGGLAIWVSIESFIGVGLCLSVLAIYWILERADYSKKIAVVLCAMWPVLTLALFSEHPWDEILLPEYDRYSIVHWTVLSLMTILWAGIAFVEERLGKWHHAYSRFWVAVLGGGFVFVILWIVYPKFFYGPLVDVNPLVKSLMWNRISETQPLLSWDMVHFHRVILFLGIALPAAPYLIWLIWKKRNRPEHFLWVLVGFGFLVFLPLAISEARWAGYAEVFLVFPFAYLAREVLLRVEKSHMIPWKSGIMVLVAVTLVFGPFVIGATTKILEQGDEKTWGERCPMVPISKFLSQTNGLGDRPRTILTFMNFGPELLYRTPHKIVTSPSHRNARGFLDIIRVMTATEDQEAKQIIDDRKIDLILLCPNEPEKALYLSASGQSTWYDNLRDGKHPSWIQTINLPSGLQSHFQLFEVVPETPQT